VADPVVEGRSLVLEAIRALAIACRARAAYPSDHPNVAKAVGTAQARVTAVLAAHGSVSIGVGRAHLRVGVWTLDSPQAKALADALYLRQVAVLRIDRGVQPDELRALVQWLAGPVIPLEPDTAAVGPPGYTASRHLLLQPLDYSAVRLTDAVSETSSPGPVSLTDRLLNVLLQWDPDEADWSGDGSGTGSAVPDEVAMIRWLTDFLRAQTALEQAERAGGDGGTGEPDAGSPAATSGGVPSAIDDGAIEDAASPGEGAVDGSRAAPRGTLPARLLTRLEETTTRFFEGMAGAGRVLAARQMAQLIMRLPETLRESLMRAALRALAPDADGGEALEAFVSTSAAHPVLRVLRQLAAEGVALSRHAQRLVELLASTRPASEAEEEPSIRDLDVLRSELLTLFRDEDIDRYNPEDHLALLARSMLAWPTRTPVVLGSLESLGERVSTLTDDAVGRRLADTLLDLLGRRGDDDKAPAVLVRLEQVVEGALTRGAFETAAATIEGVAHLSADETVPEATRAMLRARLDRFARAEILSALAGALGTPGAAPGPAVRLVRLLGPEAIRGLLGALVDEQARTRRRRIFDLLSALGADVVPEATRWLSDPNWFVVRNMIALLRAVGDRTSLETLRRLTVHADLRVRLEALRSVLELDPATGHAHLLAAMTDADPRAATAAVELAGQHGGSAAVEPLLGLLAAWDLRGRRRAVRLAALHALGRLGRPEALPRLAPFFRERWLPFPAVAERRAAYESLQGYPPDARGGLVERGRRARDQEIRAVCERLRGSG
jgi:HEAT repeat protein